ncbi:Exodeoxyribonuclease I subunit D [Roseivivax marinus]|uniref:exonuclease subunit SbcD n=1 Tax=Roseivivax marinus TaxID=1379903 RepID=UPI0008BA98FB|nr:exonuclease subunit SbcD [Roseivivax marinus]SEL89358.1 Exodeoxyribonuclease I subunit D [Roseivivax marinus]
MRILHTADWHIGQTLNGWSRDEEHRVWLHELCGILTREEIDVLLVSGDVFDGINPSGDSQRLLYSALRRFKDARPTLRTVITGGNHDPAGRLEAPSAILESLDVHVFATVRRDGEEILADRHMVPLPGPDGAPRAWVCAIPFLRAPDLPGLSFAAGEGRGSPIVEAARRFHAMMAARARETAGDLPVIAMGHLHCHGATESEGAERRILIGGEHALPEDVFPEAFDYVALGHLHRHQTLGGRIRYSGSCFPLSAAEAGYDHGVTVLEIEGSVISHTHVPIARPAEMLRFPQRGTMTFAEFKAALDDLDLDPDTSSGLQPFVYVNLEATGPAAVLLGEAEKLLAAAPVRPAGIRVQRDAANEDAAPELQSLGDTNPEALFRPAFEKVNGTAPEDRHIAAFREASVGE